MESKEIELKGIKENQRYLLAVSGGLDSMVMAHLFLKALKLGYCKHLEVAHCNFQLRAHESDEDAVFVKDWCQLNHIVFHQKNFETEAYAKTQKVSIQLAARELRYAFFEQLLNQQSLDMVCTAHHLDDNIETLLFHFFRGTGIKGLTGIPQHGKGILRPMLHLSKSALKAYAQHHLMPFREDSSNAKTTYTRNNIRHNILPFLESQVEGVRQHLAQNLVRMNEANEIYTQAIQNVRKRLIERRGQDDYIPILKLKKLRPLSTILFELLQPYQFNFNEAQEVLKRINQTTNSIVENHLYRVIKHRNFLVITAKKTAQADFLVIDAFEQEYTQLETIDFHLQLRKLIKMPSMVPISKHELFVDVEKLVFPLVLRKWQLGDYIYPLGMNKKKKVARILIDAKIPIHEKEKIWVLESGKKIVWVLGQKMDHRFRITTRTNQIMYFNYK